MKRSSFLPVVSAVIFILSFNSCSKSPRCWGSDKNKGLIIESVNIPCTLVKEGKEFVVNDQATYEAMFESSCVLPSIDFSTFTLLGQYAKGGCETKYIREVEKKSNGKIHYRVKVKECGFCKVLRYSYNWVLIPKVERPEDISFEIK